MALLPISNEIVSSFGQYFYAGSGPSHTTLTQIFRASGYGDHDPYDVASGAPNKQNRVLAVGRAAVRQPRKAKEFIENLLTELRVYGCFNRDQEDFSEVTAHLQRAFAREGWSLSEEGYLTVIGAVDLETGGRSALDEQLKRIQRNVDDPGALLGTSKDLLEAISKFVLEEWGMLPERKIDFDQALHLALDRLGLLPTQVDASQPSGKEIRAIYQSAHTTAKAVRGLRNLEGTGHGRTLPTGVSPETGRYVVREAAHIAELMLGTHDRLRGRSFK